MKSVISMMELNPALRERMDDATQLDGGHHAPLATHVFLRNHCEIVGAAGISVPMFTFWAMTTATPRESLEMTRLAKEHMTAFHQRFLTACCPDSPFYPLMGHLGYYRLGPAELFQNR